MKTTLLISAIAFILAFISWDTAPKEVQTPHVFCCMCETKIDTVGDKALRQWLDTDTRIKFKKWLILKERNRK
jgi:hypothetical protein